MEFDKDLTARQEARELARRAETAQRKLAELSQSQLDAIVEAVAKAFAAQASALAEMAVQETGFGNAEDKRAKNLFASQRVAEAVRGMKTVGILREVPEKKLWEIGVPVGVIAAIIPSTNPTSTVCYKAMIALKSGNAIVFSPHPKAIACTRKAAQIVSEAAQAAGAPADAVACLSIPSLDGCQELMKAEPVRLILATGGPGMVKAAYSSGKPAIGVGAGNGPAYIHRSADVAHALACIARSKSFDYGTVCASEQSIIVEKSMESAVRSEGERQGFYFMDTTQAGALAKLLFRPNGTLNPDIVGRPAAKLAEAAGFSVPNGTEVLVAREQEAGPTRPYSMEKLCPVLALFVMDSEDAVLSKCMEVLRHESALVNNYYGYFYPSARDAWVYSTARSAEIMAKPDNLKYFDFHPVDSKAVRWCDHLINLYRVAVQRIPFISLTMSSATYVWIMIAVVVYLLRRHSWRALAIWVPLLGVLAVCLIGPCNGSTYMRYLYPVIACMPFAIGATITRSDLLWT